MQTEAAPGAGAAYRDKVQIEILGTVALVDGERPMPLGGPKQRTVLALLVPEVGRPVSVDALIVGLYGEDASGGARRTIHTYVSNLRREVGDLIVRSGDGYVLNVDPAAVDAVRFEEMYRQGSGLVDSAPDRAVALLRDALALWRGHPYADVVVRDLLETETVRLQELRLAALDARISAELALGLHRDLIGEVSALVAEHPLRESLRGHQMVALYRSGRQSEALRAYARTREYLGDELGIEPSPELQKLEQQILDQDPALQVHPAASIERRAILAVELDESLRFGPTRELDALLGRRNEILAAAASSSGGTLLDVRGTAVYAAFSSVAAAVDAVRVAVDATAQVAIDFGDVEMGVHDAVGPPITKALRLAAVAHPGQVLLSEDAQARLVSEDTGGWSIAALGLQAVRGFDRSAQVFQLVGEGLAREFPELRLDRLPPPLPGTVAGSVPGYELREELGGGVSGVVHRAYQAAIGREVAVRVIRPELVGDPRFVRRFEAVAQRIAAIDHPHLVPLVDYWREPSQAFLVHRLVAGASLQVGASARLDAGRMMTRLEQVGAGLAAAHARGLAHGRIYPGNVLEDDAGYVFLTDTGLAVMFQGMVSPPATAYTAPEAIGGAASVAADIYSLGVLAVEFLAGRAPDDGPLPQLGTGVDDVIARATHPQPDRRHSSVNEFLEDLAGAVGDVGPAASAAREKRTTARNPYKGLLAFGEADAADFYGRKEIVSQLASAVEDRPFTLLAGPSGIGKSSVVRAGLVPAVRASHASDGPAWLVTDMFPGARPFDALEAALNRVATETVANRIEALRSGTAGLNEVCAGIVPGERLLIVVDQFEELFTHTTDENTRQRFLEMLTELNDDQRSPVRVVATTRADFLDRPLRYAEFSRTVGSSTITLGAPTAEDLAEIVRVPAEGVGVEVDAALVEALTHDAGAEPGALPLLQHALTELFERRATNRLTLDGYRAAGGLAGSIGRRAEAVYGHLTHEDQALTRRLFLHLVSVDADSDATRRRVRRPDLDGLDAASGSVDRVLDSFGRHRLLVFDRDAITRGPTVEVAHEALLSRWDRLAAWIGASREDLLVARRLEIAAQDWAAAERDESYLLTGAQLGQSASWRTDSALRPSPVMTEFLDASAAHDLQAKAERRRRRRVTLSGFAAAALVAMVLAVVAWVQRSSAESAAAEAEARGLMLEAEQNMSVDPELSLLLATESVQAFRSSGEVPGRAIDVLRASIDNQSVVSRHPGGSWVARVPGTTTFATPDPEGGIAIWDAATQELRQRIAAPDGHTVLEAYAPDAGDDLFVLLESAPDAGHWRTLSPESERWSTLPGADGYGLFATDPGGQRYAVESDGKLTLWDRESGNEIRSFEGIPNSLPALSADGRFAFAAREGDSIGVDIVDLPDGAASTSITDIELADIFLTFAPSGDQLLVSSYTFLILYDLADASVIWERRDLTRSWIPRWLDDSGLIAAGGLGTLSLLDAETGRTVGQISGHVGGAIQAALFDDIDLLVTAGTSDDATVVHRLSSSDASTLAGFDLPHVSPIGMVVSADGNALIAHDQNGYDVVDATSGEMIRSERGLDQALTSNSWTFPVFAPSGSFVAYTDSEDVSQLISVPTGDVVYTAPALWHIRGVNGDGSRVVISRDEVGAQLVDTSGESVVSIEVGDTLHHATFTNDGRFVLTGVDGDGRLWDAGDGKLISTWSPEAEDIGGLWSEFTHDGSRLVVGGGEGRLRIFDMDRIQAGLPIDEAEMLRIKAHDATIVRLAISPDDRIIATTAWDQKVKLWDLASGDQLGEFGSDNPDAIAFHPTEPWLYVASGATVSVYTLDLDELIGIAEAHITRQMTEDECRLYLHRACETLPQP